MPAGASRLTWPVLLFAASVLLGSAWGAKQTYGRPLVRLFVDPFADVSAVYLPSWPSSGWGLEGGERLVALRRAAPPPGEGGGPAEPPERVVLSGEGRSALGIFDRAVAGARLRGDSAIVIEFESGEERTLALDGRTFGVDELWWFWGLYALAGLAMLWSGLTAYRLAGRRAGARALLGLSVSAFVFLVTFFDYHTTRRFAPLFAASTVGNLVGLCAVALYFPNPPRLPASARAALPWLAAAAASLGLALALGAAFDRDLRPLRLFVNALSPFPPALLALSVVLRFRGAEGGARRELVSATWGLVPGPLLLAGLALYGGPALHLALPFAVVAFPLAVGYALVRRNILDTDHLLYRRLFVAPVGLAGAIAGGCVWALLRGWFLADGLSAYKASASAGLVAASVGGAVCASLWAVIERVAFPSGARFRPTIEKLADQLATSSDEGAIRVYLCILVQRWLDTDGVTFHEPRQGSQRPLWRDLAAGRKVLDRRKSGERLLFVPLRSSGQLLGALCVSPKGEGAPFSAEDLALLDTIALLGALGIHNARALRRIEDLRRFEVEVSEGGRRLALELIGAELAHEIAYPINYFRHLLDRLERGQPYGRADIDLGSEEVERLRRLVAALRKPRRPPAPRRPVALGPLVERSLSLLRGAVEKRGVETFVDVPEAAYTLGHPDRALQLLLNLVKNAVEHAPDGGRVEIVARLEGGGVVLDVRDDGPGVPEELRESVFRPWVSHRPGGSGLGLFVARQVAAAFGWRLHYLRDKNMTVFRVEAPSVPAPSGEDKVVTDDEISSRRRSV